MDRSVNSHEAGSNAIVEEVWYGGTDALKEGEGVCYNTDYGTATAINGRRGNRVERPHLTNNRAFAGVADADYSAKAGGQMIRINCPGSKGVNVALGVDTVIGTGILTFTAGASGSHRGRFSHAGFGGRGSIVPRQTVTAVIESGWTGATWTLAADGITLTVADASLFTAGDTVVFVGGEDDGTGLIVPGKYIVASADEVTTVVLTASAVDTTPAGTLDVTGYAYTGEPKCQADLLEGEESGGIEFLSPPNAGSAAMPHLPGGVTYVCGGVTLAADCDIDLAEGTFLGMEKGVSLLGDLATSDFTIDLVTSTHSTQLDGATNLTEILTIDNVGDGWYGAWSGAWRTHSLILGATEG